MAAPRSTPLVCSGHTRPIPQLHFSCPPANSSSSSSDPSYLLISSCKDGKPQLRNWTGDWLGTFLGHKGAVWSSKLSNDGDKAVTASADFSAKFWDTTTGTCVLTLQHEHIVRSVDINSSSNHILTGGAEKKLRLWDVSSLSEGETKEAVEFREKDGTNAHDAMIKSVLFDDENRTVISMGDDKVIKWWDTRTLSPITSLSFTDPITSLAHAYPSISPTELSITTGSKIQFIPVSPLSTSTPEGLKFEVDYPASTASLCPTERRKGERLFVTGSTQDESVRLHSFSSATSNPDSTRPKESELKEVGKGHHGPVHCVSFSPDGEMYATGSEDGTIRMWQTPEPRSWGLWKFND